LGRGLGWVTHRGPCQPLPCWDSVILGLALAGDRPHGRGAANGVGGRAAHQWVLPLSPGSWGLVFVPAGSAGDAAVPSPAWCWVGGRRCGPPSPQVSPTPPVGQIFWKMLRLHPAKVSSFQRAASNSACKGRAQRRLRIVRVVWRRRCARQALPPVLGSVPRPAFGINRLWGHCKAQKLASCWSRTNEAGWLPILCQPPRLLCV